MMIVIKPHLDHFLVEASSVNKKIKYLMPKFRADYALSAGSLDCRLAAASDSVL